MLDSVESEKLLRMLPFLWYLPSMESNAHFTCMRSRFAVITKDSCSALETLVITAPVTTRQVAC